MKIQIFIVTTAAAATATTIATKTKIATKTTSPSSLTTPITKSRLNVIVLNLSV